MVHAAFSVYFLPLLGSVLGALCRAMRRRQSRSDKELIKKYIRNGGQERWGWWGWCMSAGIEHLFVHQTGDEGCGFLF